MMPSRVEPWTPPQGPDVTLLPAGRWWDAVRVPSSLGSRVLARLGENSGAVIEDGFGAILYWLVWPGAADEWVLLQPSVSICGATTYVAVPPVTYTEGPGLRWATPLSPTRYLTDPELLRAALATEIDAVMGRRAGQGRAQ
ncbi:hypothetical protein ACIRNI_09445 [Streptomyces sp. NPDC093546]|uniref:hypothetical protein n=1 Tax=Streptomyces sp. NPDC093546 TaxID=3366040 RepID=UPI00382BBA91